jgi:hypothetical protein
MTERGALVRRLALAAPVAVALLLLALLTIAAARPVRGQEIDLSGEWSIQVTGFEFGSTACQAHIEQSLTAVWLDVACPSMAHLSFTGVVDPRSGQFVVSAPFGGISVSVLGTASSNAIAGTLRIASGDDETFVGVRLLPTPTPLPILPLDLTGDWPISLSPEGCLLYLEQDGTSLTGAGACAGEWPKRLTGTVDPEQDAFEINWTLGSTIDIRMEGTAEYSQFSRSWFYISGTIDSSFSSDLLPSGFDSYRISGSIWGTPNCMPPHPVGPLPRPSPHNRAMDALLLVQYSAQLIDLGGLCLALCDVNLDQHVDARDAMLILQVEAGLIPRLPVL